MRLYSRHCNHVFNSLSQRVAINRELLLLSEGEEERSPCPFILFFYSKPPSGNCLVKVYRWIIKLFSRLQHYFSYIERERNISIWTTEEEDECEVDLKRVLHWIAWEILAIIPLIHKTYPITEWNCKTLNYLLLCIYFNSPIQGQCNGRSGRFQNGEMDYWLLYFQGFVSLAGALYDSWIA